VLAKGENMIATLPHDPRIDNRNAHIFAVKAMLAKPPHPAEDTESVMWVGANRAPGDTQDLVLAEMAASVCRDAILLVFDNLRGSDAPRGFTVITIGDHPKIWPGCRLWAPVNGGPALLIAKDGCSFGWDGRLLVRGARRPRAAIDRGLARARSILRREVQAVTAEQAGIYVRVGIGGDN
jgi:hypothetical protein